MPWSPLQEDIFKFVVNGKGSAVVEAVAGSGKTTTIVECANRIPTSLSCAFVAFNKSIAEELKTRLPKHVRAQTLNGMGFSAWLRFTGSKLNVDGNKVRGIIDQIVPREHLGLYGAALRKIVALAKSVGLVPKGVQGAISLTQDMDMEWIQLMEHHDVEFEDGADPDQGLAYARQILVRDIEMRDSVVDFDDQLYFPVIFRARFWQNDLLFVDEAQDVNMIQRAMLRRALKPGGRIIAVGDPCQPAGTAVTIKRNGKELDMPIEKVCKGDRVISYVRHGSYFNVETVEKVSSRTFSGSIYAIAAGGKISRYTENHWCLVNFKPLKDNYCTYLMRKENRFRVGVCKLGYREAIGPVHRMKMEGADAVWILKTYETKREALLQELQLSYEYNLPTVTFAPVGTKGVQLDKETLNYFWIGINNLAGAKQCLESHGRILDYPIAETGQQWQLSVRRPTLVRACNLLFCSLILKYSGATHTDPTDWRPVQTITHARVFREKVFSLEISNTQLYIADGLVTHNCQAIYGFRGADTDAIQNILQEFGAQILPLTISYRCPQAVVQEAQKYVSHIQASPSAPLGRVEWLEQHSVKEFLPTDAVLCRNTAPLVDLAYKCIRAGVGCRVLGREIGQGLVALINKMKTKSIETLLARLDLYLERETAKFMAKKQEERAAALADRVDTIRVFVDQLGEGPSQRTVPQLVRNIESLFSDNGSGVLTLCTIHKAKGLEWDRVFIYEPDLMPSKYARQAWQKQQEVNLQYVAVTRAKQELFYITKDAVVITPRQKGTAA